MGENCEQIYDQMCTNPVDYNNYGQIYRNMLKFQQVDALDDDVWNIVAEQIQYWKNSLSKQHLDLLYIILADIVYKMNQGETLYWQHEQKLDPVFVQFTYDRRVDFKIACAVDCLGKAHINGGVYDNHDNHVDEPFTVEI